MLCIESVKLLENFPYNFTWKLDDISIFFLFCFHVTHITGFNWAITRTYGVKSAKRTYVKCQPVCLSAGLWLRGCLFFSHSLLLLVCILRFCNSRCSFSVLRDKRQESSLKPPLGRGAVVVSGGCCCCSGGCLSARAQLKRCLFPYLPS